MIQRNIIWIILMIRYIVIINLELLDVVGLEVFLNLEIIL